ncbi:Palmitoyltransferase zdhhc18 [Boothiomyces sp. JEL0866]|nr:Palmitoyltransferase zdhhc18 [Boothiomyces sp. JEL0866]
MICEFQSPVNRPDQHYFLFGFAVALTCNILFSIYVGSDIAKDYPEIVVVYAIIAITTTATHILSNTVQPGYVPKDADPDPSRLSPSTNADDAFGKIDDIINETRNKHSNSATLSIQTHTDTSPNNAFESAYPLNLDYPQSSPAPNTSDIYNPHINSQNVNDQYKQHAQYPFISVAPPVIHTQHIYTRTIMINNYPIECKYCTSCRCWRPPRSSHCSDFLNHDHHCPWMGNCIGKYNYKYFFIFLQSLFVNNVFVLVFSITNLTNYPASDLSDHVVPLILAIFSSIMIWSTTGMAGYHCWITSKNKTTREELKGLYEEGNPFDQKSCPRNFRAVLCHLNTPPHMPLSA